MKIDYIELIGFKILIQRNMRFSCPGVDTYKTIHSLVDVATQKSIKYVAHM